MGEFELCDLDKSESLNVTEIGVCQEKQAKIIHDRLPFTNAKFPTRIDLRRIFRRKQRQPGGMSYDDFITAKSFFVEVWARAMLVLHDNDPEDGKICPDEWWHVAQQHRRMLKGYSSKGLEELWADYRNHDINRTYVLEIDELRWALETSLALGINMPCRSTI